MKSMCVPVVRNAIHDYQFRLILKASKGSQVYLTDAGPIGFAVNGVPIFDPSTQGSRHALTGNRPHN